MTKVTSYLAALTFLSDIYKPHKRYGLHINFGQLADISL